MKIFITTFALLLLTSLSFAQIRGSGITITKTYDYQNFNKVIFDDLDGKLEIEVGKPFSISITIDDNLLYLLNVAKNAKNKKLTIALKGNYNNKLYIEDTKIKVKITMPFLTEVNNNGNSGLIVTNINSKNLKCVNPANGTTTLVGVANDLEVTNSGNGVLNAKQLVVKNANIKASGNGNVYANVSEFIIANTSGNCTVLNAGKAKYDASSSSRGNSSYVIN